MGKADLARKALAAFAAATTLPYPGLKAQWLLGGRTGILDPEFGRSASMHALNVLTGGLDLVALVLAVVFFRGLRAPAWLVLPPMWVGAGLLGQILVAFPVILLTSSGPSSPGSGQVPPLADWVYLLVYGCFAGLGIGLLGAFAVYAWQRWGQLAPEPGRRSGLPSGSAGTGEVVESVLRLVAGITGGLALVALATRRGAGWGAATRGGRARDVRARDVRARDAGRARPATARTTSPARPGR